jgi:hypothetical protein
MRRNAVIKKSVIATGIIGNWRYEPKSNPAIKQAVIGIKG